MEGKEMIDMKWFDPVKALLFWAYIGTHLLCLIVMSWLFKALLWAVN